jgi:hypothetical protein
MSRQHDEDSHEEMRIPALDLKQRFLHVHELLSWPVVVVIAAELHHQLTTCNQNSSIPFAKEHSPIFLCKCMMMS